MATLLSRTKPDRSAFIHADTPRCGGDRLDRQNYDSVPVRIGISARASNRELVLELAELAINSGLDTLWLGDGLLRSKDYPGWQGGMESFVELAWLSGRFPAARIGISAAVLPLRDIEWLAKQANTMQHMTDDNFVLAVSAGFWDREFVHRGLQAADRGTLFRQGLHDLLSALPGNQLSPGPLTVEGPPVWLAGKKPTMNLALELGLPYQPSRADPEMLAPIAEEWFDRGGGLLAHRVYIEAGSDPFPGHEVDRNFVSGSPQQIADAIGRFAELGVGDLSISPGHDDASARRTVEALAAIV